MRNQPFKGIKPSQNIKLAFYQPFFISCRLIFTIFYLPCLFIFANSALVISSKFAISKLQGFPSLQ